MNEEEGKIEGRKEKGKKVKRKKGGRKKKPKEGRKELRERGREGGTCIVCEGKPYGNIGNLNVD